jgi:hypothetical protein
MCRPGSFCGLRLLPGDALDAAMPEWYAELAQAVVEDPPYEQQWLRTHPGKVFVLRLPSA